MDEMVSVPVNPPFGQKYIVTGIREVNGEETKVYLTYTDEGGGWHQWTTHKYQAVLFDNEKAGLKAAKYCPGPWFNIPRTDSIKAESTEHPKLKAWRKILNEVLGLTK